MCHLLLAIYTLTKHLKILIGNEYRLTYLFSIYQYVQYNLFIYIMNTNTVYERIPKSTHWGLRSDKEEYEDFQFEEVKSKNLK